jgi:hypothetical protein
MRIVSLRDPLISKLRDSSLEKDCLNNTHQISLAIHGNVNSLPPTASIHCAIPSAMNQADGGGGFVVDLPT